MQINHRTPIIHVGKVTGVAAPELGWCEKTTIRATLIASYVFGIAAIGCEAADLHKESDTNDYATLGLNIEVLIVDYIHTVIVDEDESGCSCKNNWPDAFAGGAIIGAIIDLSSSVKKVKEIGSILSVAANSCGVLAKLYVDISKGRCSKMFNN